MQRMLQNCAYQLLWKLQAACPKRSPDSSIAPSQDRSSYRREEEANRHDAARVMCVEKHATESHKEGKSAIKLDPPSFVVETPFHRVTTERPAGLICVEKIGLARRRLPPTALPSRSGSNLRAECGIPLHAD